MEKIVIRSQNFVVAQSIDPPITRQPTKKKSQSIGREFYFGAEQKHNATHKFCSNFIKTSKYTWWNFLPFSILIQFKRYANIYFLFQAILQSISYISPYNPLSAVAPLILVIGLSVLRDLYEDIQKKKSDMELNSSTACKLVGSNWVNVKWKDIVVGDFIKVKEYEFFSTDLIVIKSSHNTGACFIETSSLDGEKNLKSKLAPLDLNNFINENNLSISGVATCDLPNGELHKYNGLIRIEGLSKDISLNEKQLLLRGAVLKNTEWIIGIVVYTGMDTKVMKNSEQPKFKQSKIEYITNKIILFILFLQLGLCVVSAFGSGIFNAINQDNYLTIYFPDHGASLEAFLIFFTVELLLSSMIPISLVVSLEFVKLCQGYFMQKDLDMYSKEKDRFCKVFTTSINEELGQVAYIFSDKTGTLTCNKMEFRMCCIGNELYGDDSLLKISPKFQENLQKQQTAQENELVEIQKNDFQPAIHDRLKLLPRAATFQDLKQGISYSFSDENLSNIINQKKKNLAQIDLNLFDNNNNISYKIENEFDLVNEFFLILSLCHDCIVEKEKDSNQIKHYQGQSPDEITLVDSARHLGYTFNGKTSKSIFLKIRDVEEEIEVLKDFEFNSDRKRMSIIIKHKGLIKFLIKGADVTILPRLNKQTVNSQPFENFIKSRLTEFSKIGLRTLCMGMRIISQIEWEEIQHKIDTINSGDGTLKEKLTFELAESIEKNFTLIGCTAVEDKLQDEVPEVIRDLLKANIKVWMLTGDKLETAENIGYSCQLIQSDFKVFKIDENVNPSEIIDNIEGEVDLCVLEKKRKTILVEGSQLGIILKNEDLENRFIDIFTKCDSVICCRVTPKQKADVVRLVKKHLGKICLSIGDGANDVNMIQEAHIGIGIYGNEGMRAVQASDYAIPEFKCVWKLLFTHGKWSYMRITEMILYFFYKNMLISVGQFYFLFINFWSGQTIFDDWYYACYNLAFTSWPLIIRALFDQDINYKSWVPGQKNHGKLRLKYLKTLKQNFPYLYYVGQRNLIFTGQNVIKWISQGVSHGLLIFLCVMYSTTGAINSEGQNSDFWFFSITIYTGIILVANLKISLYTRFWTYLNVLSIIGISLFLYFAFVWIVDQFSSLLLWKTCSVMFASPQFYIAILLCLGTVAIYDMVALIIDNEYYRSIADWYRVIIQGKDLENDEVYEIAKNKFHNTQQDPISLKKKNSKRLEKNKILNGVE